MNRYRTLILMLMLIGGTWEAAAQNPNCSRATPPVDANAITIDARDGSVAGPSRFRVLSGTRTRSR